MKKQIDNAKPEAKTDEKLSAEDLKAVRGALMSPTAGPAVPPLAGFELSDLDFPVVGKG